MGSYSISFTLNTKEQVKINAFLSVLNDTRSNNTLETVTMNDKGFSVTTISVIRMGEVFHRFSLCTLKLFGCVITRKFGCDESV